ncbi:LuxR C-terminal-related transcriptional regulator [Amycolatopsis sp. TRM77291]
MEEGAKVFAKDASSTLPEQLSQRELAVLQHLATGMSNVEVAARLLHWLDCGRGHCLYLYPFIAWARTTA